MMKLLHRNGFTGMECLIVVAVLAILAAVSIPVLVSRLETARETVCAANRRSALGVYRTGLLCGEIGENDGTAAYAADAEEYVQSHGVVLVCPDEKSGSHNIRFDSATGQFLCEKHSGVQQLPAATITAGVTSLKDVLQTLAASDADFLALGQRTDSTSNGAKVTAVQEALGGVDLARYGLTSWCVYTAKNAATGANVQQIIWTDEDVTAKNAGDALTVFRYNLTGPYAGLYSVWTTRVESAVNSGDKSTYLRINAKESTSGMRSIKAINDALTNVQKQDFSNVYQAYLDYISPQGS